MEFRDYQQRVIDASVNHMRSSTLSFVIDMATGSGKSWVAAALAKELYEASGKKTLILAPSKELIEQNHEKYTALGEPASLFSASVGVKSTKHPAIFGSPLTVANHLDSFQSGFAALLIDEAHGTTPTMRKIAASMRQGNPNLRIGGLTATPHRTNDGFIFRLDESGDTMEEVTNKEGREPFFDKRIAQVPAQELIDKGWLTPINVVSGGEQLHYDADNMSVQATGKFKAEEERAVFEGKGRLTSDIVADVIRQADPRFGVMFFAQTVAHAMEVLSSLPDDAELVTGKTKKSERNKILSDFKSGNSRYVVNVNVLTTGFDAPNVGTIAILRATESVGLLHQIIGRGMRLFDAGSLGMGNINFNDLDKASRKDFCLILDYAGNMPRHAPDGDIFNPVITARISQTAKKVEAKCPDCGFINHFGGKPNPDMLDIDKNGFFTDGLGNPLLNKDGFPLAGHMGQRCHRHIETKTDLLQCDYRWNIRACPDCGAQNSYSSRFCINKECGAELINPNDKLILTSAAKQRRKWVNGKVTSMTGRPTTHSYEINYKTEDGEQVREYVNPLNRKAWLADASRQLLISLGMDAQAAGSAGKHEIDAFINSGEARKPRAIIYAPIAGNAFFDIRQREFNHD